MAVSLNVSVVVDAAMRHESFEIDPAGIRTVRELLARADDEGLLGERFFKRLLGWRRRGSLTVLHNGRRLALPRELRNPVADGDEVSVLTPIVGG